MEEGSLCVAAIEETAFLYLSVSFSSLVMAEF